MALDTNNNLTTLAATKTYLNVSGTSWDSQITDLINSASHYVNGELGYPVKRRSLTEYYDGNGRPELYLRRHPIRSVSTNITVHVANPRENFATTTEFTTSIKVKSSELAVYSTRGSIRRKDNVFHEGRQNVKVVYDAGWNTTAATTTADALPQDLLHATHAWIAFQFNIRRENREGVRTVSHDDGAETYTDRVPETVSTILMRYRDPAFLA